MAGLRCSFGGKHQTANTSGLPKPEVFDDQLAYRFTNDVAQAIYCGWMNIRNRSATAK